MSPADWLVARRRASVTVNAMALSASLITGWAMAMVAGQFFAGEPVAIAWVVGPMLALALSALLIAPFLRKSGAATPTHLIAERFRSLPASLAFAGVVFVAGILLLWSQFLLAGQFGHLLFGIDRQIAVVAAACLTALVVLPGGLRGTLRVNAVIFAFLATAYLAPLVWAAFGLGTLPIPHVSFGHGALSDIKTIEQQLSQLGFAQLGGQIDGVEATSQPLTTAIAASLFLAIGLCAMPFVLGHFSASESPSGSRKTAGWAILGVASVLAAAPALAAFAKLYLYRSILGLTSDETGASASWLFAWGGKQSLLDAQPIARLCGRAVQDAAQAVAACGGNPDYVIGPADIRLSIEAITLGMADFFGMAGIFSGLIGAAVLAATLAVANAVAWSIGANLSADLPRAKSGTKRQSLAVLFKARLAVLVALAAATWLTLQFAQPPAELFMWALAIGAGVIAPLLAAAIWWDRLNVFGALAGTVVGAAVLLLQAWAEWGGAFGFAPVTGLP
ncbi:MAG: hypothetical protein KDJ29_21385, partial [Hyphomicrobiales bacterium]|nr:hypothetical protein [Hyphomicrobiales bacterium]